MEIPNIILINDTIEKFGYDPRLLKGKKDYNKKIVRNCFKCKNKYEQKFINAIRAFKENKECKFCANKKRSLDNANANSIRMKEKISSGELKPPMLNRKHTKDVKLKAHNRLIGKTFNDLYGEEKANEIKKKLSDMFSGDKNPFYGKKHTEQTKHLLSINSKRTTRHGKNSNLYGKKYWSKKYYEYNNIKFKSKWELKVARYFDENNIEYQYEELTFDLSDVTYTPDFFLPKMNKLIEVKGYWYNDAIIKFELFKKTYTDIIIEVWDKIKLKELNII